MYNYLVVDSVLLGYQILNSSDKNPALRNIVQIENRKVYGGFLKKLLETIEFLEKKYLLPNGEIIFLFDNYESREELKQLFVPLPEASSRKAINASYKSNRRSNKVEFYASLDILRYYMLINSQKYHTARIPNLEADDLVRPCLDHIVTINSNAKVLLITNDSDWCKYLTDNVHYLPELYKEPLGTVNFIDKYAFSPTEDSIILYKILYGDDADNIKAIFPELKPQLKQYILKTYSSLIDFLYESKNDTQLQPFIQLIKEKESEIKIAYKMLAAIPVSKEHFLAVYTTGRNSVSKKRVIDGVILQKKDTEQNSGFAFGGIKIPRYMPKEGE